MSEPLITPANDRDRPKFSLRPDSFGAWIGYVVTSQNELIVSLVLVYGIGLLLDGFAQGAAAASLLLWAVFAVIDHRKGLLPYKPMCRWDSKRLELYERFKQP